MSNKKGIAILGSTGSTGIKALDIIETYPDYFDVQGDFTTHYGLFDCSPSVAPQNNTSASCC